MCQSAEPTWEALPGVAEDRGRGLTVDGEVVIAIVWRDAHEVRGGTVQRPDGYYSQSGKIDVWGRLLEEDRAAVTGKKPNIIDTGVWAVQRHPTAGSFPR